MFSNNFRLEKVTRSFHAFGRNLFCVSIFLLLIHVLCFDVKAQWSSQTSGTTNNLFSVHFLDGSNGWAVGGNNTILQTTNGGTNWSPVTGPGGLPTASYLGVRFIDANTGWVGGGRVVLRTGNGGGSWDALVDTNASNFRNNLFAVSSTQAWTPVTTTGARFFARYTYSGGIIIEEDFDVLTGSSSFFDIYFTDADNGWAVGFPGQIRRITNASSGSPTFAAQTSGTTQTLNGIFMLNANTGWAVGNAGTILTTTNGGANWSPQTSGTTTNLRSVHFVNSNMGWAVGDGGLILTTTNGGTSWTSQTVGTQTLRRVFFVNSSIGFAAGLTGTILKNAAPTAAGVTIGGRVTDSWGRGISKATVTLTGGFSFEERVTLTNPFGYFFFDDVEVGSSYIVSVSRKGFVFAPGFHFFSLSETRSDLNFTALEMRNRQEK